MSDEYVLDTPAVREFIAGVREAIAAAPLAEALDALRPAFAALLGDRSWLPEALQQPDMQGGMGGGIATWLIFRAADSGLSLFALVVPAGAATPVHDHLAWGLVGLYAGEQDEEVFRPTGPSDARHAPLELAGRNQLRPGDFYVLLPPEGDIHRVLTTSPTPSASVHLLGNDTGCVVRHAYSPESGGVRSFRSGWSNAACQADHGEL